MTDFAACSKELKTLGLQPRVTWNDVQAAYRRLAMQLHPDRRLQKRDEEGQEHVDRFRQINEAYERLRRYHAEERMRSKEHLFRICTDPAAASLEIEELELRLRHSSSPQVRAAAALLLGKQVGERSTAVLMSACADPDAQVRSAAMEALKNTGGAWEMLRGRAAAWLHGVKGEHRP